MNGLPQIQDAPTADLPQWLDRPRALDVEEAAFGTLRPAGDGLHWLIEGDPQAVLMAKRLFPGSQGQGRGVAKFPAGPRRFGDLVWFLQRFPLRVLDRAAFEAAYAETREHAAARQAVAEIGAPGQADGASPARETAPGAQFQGVLRPFQAEGLAWLLANRRTLLADEMGLGKTPQALALLARLGTDAWPALVVVPPHLVRHWRDKLGQFLGAREVGTDLFAAAPQLPGDGPRVHVIRGITPYALPAAEIYVLHYLLAAHWRQALADLGARTALFDEIQELRHRGTQKYSACHEVAQRAASTIGLSGTPIYNRGGEIWNVLNVIEMHCLGDWDGFTREWCTGYGSDTVADPDALGAYLRREGLLLRRRKEDVLADLPAKRRLVQSVDVAEGHFRELCREAVTLARDAAGREDPFARGREELEAVALYRRATGVAKLPEAVAFLRTLLEAGEPCLIFAHHHDVYAGLMDGLRAHRPVEITGRVGERGKAEAREAFMEGRTDACVISLRAAAGLDGLQERARVVVFAELDWSPAVHTQAEDRAHRMGQRDSVLVYYLVSDFGADPPMQDALGLKASQFLGLMGEQAESEQDRALAESQTKAHMRAMLARIRSGEHGGQA